MQKRPILYLAMEIKARELEARTLLAHEAACRGFQVILGNKNHIYAAINAGYLPPGIFFDKSLTRGKEEYLQNLIDKGCVLASQDEESGLLDFAYSKFLSVRATPETVDMASAIFCWGRYDYGFWTDAYPDAYDKIHVTGSPRIDYWRPDFQGYYASRINRYQQSFGKFVLISSNFPSVNGYMSHDELMMQAKQIGSVTTEEEESARWQRYADDAKMFEHFVALIAKLAYVFPDINFVVRPHPTEKLSGWQGALPDYKNIHVLFEGSIGGWIRASQIVLHNGCTSGIEAYVAKIPALAYVPFASKRNREVPNQLSIVCETEDMVQQALQEILDGKNIDRHRTKENDQLVQSRLSNVSGPTAAAKVSDVLRSFSGEAVPVVQPGLREWKIDISYRIQRLRNALLKRDNKKNRKFPGLKSSELDQIHNNLLKVSCKYSCCSYRHLFGDVYLITANY